MGAATDPDVGNPSVAQTSPQPRSAAAGAGSRRRIVTIAGIIVVVAIVAILTLDASGVWPASNHGPSYPTGATSFGGWKGLAQGTANGYQAGPWLLVKADAAIFASSWGIDPASLLVAYHAPNCSLTMTTGLATNVPVAGLTNISQGISYDWLYWFSNPGGSAGLAVLVVNGSATVIGTFLGTQCATSAGQSGAVPSGVIDSSAAARGIGVSGEYAYVGTHSVSNGVLSLVGNASWPGKSPGPVWTFETVDCSPINGNGTVASGPGYTGVVDGTTAASLSSIAETEGCYLPL
jgi:hypothetical protein